MLYGFISFSRSIIFFYQASLKMYQVWIYLLKVNNRNTRTRCEICSKLTMKAPERHQWCCPDVFIANFEHISHLVQVFFTVNFEDVSTGWGFLFLQKCFIRLYYFSLCRQIPCLKSLREKTSVENICEIVAKLTVEKLPR